MSSGDGEKNENTFTSIKSWTVVVRRLAGACRRRRPGRARHQYDRTAQRRAGYGQRRENDARRIYKLILIIYLLI